MKSLTFLFLLCLSTALRADQKPNVLIIIADDCTFSDLPLNGGQNAKTPHLDALANQSLVFDRAYLGMAMCSPCRSELYTGRYPHRNGCAWNHGTCRPGTKSMPHLLNPLGYRVGLAGKTHVKPSPSFPLKWSPDSTLHVSEIPPIRTTSPAARNSSRAIRSNLSASLSLSPNHTYPG